MFSLIPALLALIFTQGPTPAVRERPPVAIARAVVAGPSDTLTIAGRATTASGQLQTGALDVNVDDGTGALRVFSRSVRQVVRAGDSVVVTGVVRTYRGDRELAAIALRVVPGAPRIVQPVTASLTTDAIARMWGRLVTVRGRVSAFGHSEGGEWLRLSGLSPDDSASSVTVWVSANHGGRVRLARVRDAQRLQVTGVVSAFRDNPEDAVVWQIVPRGEEDVVQLGARWLGGTTMWLLLLAVVAVAAGALAMRAMGRREALRLRETEVRYRQLLDLMPESVIVHEEGRIIFTNPAAARLLGVLSESGLVGRDLGEFTAPESRALLMATGTHAVPSASAPAPRATRARGRMTTIDGTPVDVEITASPCRYHDREATLVLARDISQQLRVERDLESLALLDDLTGLHNRRGFTLFAEQELARARRYRRAAVLLFADMDGLKRINDVHGHAAGDLALKTVAHALRTIVRESDVVARWAGDEFVALLLEGSEAEGIDFHDRLTAALEALSPELPFAVRATVGTSRLGPDDSSTLNEALDRADAALYERKGRSRAAADSTPSTGER